MQKDDRHYSHQYVKSGFVFDFYAVIESGMTLSLISCLASLISYANWNRSPCSEPESGLIQQFQTCIKFWICTWGETFRELFQLQLIPKLVATEFFAPENKEFILLAAFIYRNWKRKTIRSSYMITDGRKTFRGEICKYFLTFCI